MKPEGIRKVIAEQSLEGAVIYLAEKLETLANMIEADKQAALPVVVEGPKEEEV